MTSMLLLLGGCSVIQGVLADLQKGGAVMRFWMSAGSVAASLST
jgi:hypothetical protein